MHCGTMDTDCMQWSRCNEAQCIPIECSGIYAAWPKASLLNAVDSMHCGTLDPDFMQWGPCSEAQCIPIECSGFYAAWTKACRLNAVYPMQRD